MTIFSSLNKHSLMCEKHLVSLVLEVGNSGNRAQIVHKYILTITLFKVILIII